MALDESDRLSLLALIVAIVALIVSAWQLAQQLFATATDGKRFCQASVMGVWARKTRLSWRWSQIRFETKYTIPEIQLSSNFPEYPIELLRTYRKTSIWYRAPVVKWLAEVSLGPFSDWDKFFEVTTDRNDAPLELRRTRSPGSTLVTTSSAERWSLRLLNWWDGSYRQDAPDVVSWPKLLERIYINQVHSVRKIDRQEGNGAGPLITTKQLETAEANTGKAVPCPDATVFEMLKGEVRVWIRLVERSWDLVPPDVVRPLAKSRVGTMIIIAHRLGVSWQGEFDPNQGQMNASGCGHTFTSERIRGLGLVLQYDFDKESEKMRNASGARRGVGYGEYLAPTITADKLHCGAVPVDTTALAGGVAVPNIHLIGPDRKFDMHGLVNRLKMLSFEAEQLKDSKHTNQYGSPLRAFKHAIEDAVSMLCPIPTQPNSYARCITWPFRTLRQPFTPTRQRNGLVTLIDLLSEYLQSHKPHARVMEDRENSILQPLDSSPLEFLKEILDKHSQIEKHRKASNASHEHHNELHKTYQRVQEIHHQTSAVFASISLPSDFADEDEDHIPFLMVLVAAHVTLATKHGRKADQTAIADDSPTPDGSKQSSNDNRKGFVEDLAKLYVEDLDKERTVRKHIRSQGYTKLLEPGVIPALWWTLVVRSACWWISVRVKLPETQIPSYWYYSQTPVYIT